MAEEGAQAPAAPPAPEAPTAAPAGGKSKKWLWIGIAAAAVAVIAVACVLVFVVFQDDIFGGSDGPDQTVQKMLDATAAKDVDALIALMDPQALQELEAGGVKPEDFKAMFTEGMTFESMEFSGVKMETKMAADGKSATVTIVEGVVTTVENGETTTEDIKDSEDAEEYKLVLVDGKWYLDVKNM